MRNFTPALAALVVAGALNAAEVRMGDNTTGEAIARFVAAGPKGATLRLDSVTDFEWDTVRAFSGTAPIALYRRGLGPDFVLDESVASRVTDDSGVLVFSDKGQVVRTILLGPPVFLTGAMGEAREPRHAVLVVATRDPGPYSAVRFAD